MNTSKNLEDKDNHKLSDEPANLKHKLKEVAPSKRILNIFIGIPLIFIGLIGFLAGAVMVLTIIGIIPAFFCFAGSGAIFMGGAYLIASKYELIKCECGANNTAFGDLKIILCKNCKRKIELIK